MNGKEVRYIWNEILKRIDICGSVGIVIVGIL